MFSLFTEIKRKLKFFLLRRHFPSSKSTQIHHSFSTGKYTRISVAPSAMIEIQDKVVFRAFVNIVVEHNASLRIEKNVFINNYSSLNCLHHISIGSNTLIGEGVKIYDHNHKYTTTSSLVVHPNEFTTAPVNIGKNCWIGSNVVILKGVSIGDNVIIGANNLIYKSVPSNTIVKLKSDLVLQSIDLSNE
jgi:acetyltransferase-like isoleucine patch superfamily enzyme